MIWVGDVLGVEVDRGAVGVEVRGRWTRRFVEIEIWRWIGVPLATEGSWGSG